MTQPWVYPCCSCHENTSGADHFKVTPYNLWTVRALRYFSVIFFIINFFWWVLLLISIFVSPPAMHSRGSGFFDFSFTTLAAGILLVSLLFFTTPSKLMQIATLIVAGFLLIDIIIILAVSRIRVEEGWVGIASVIWATLIALYTVLTDRVVQWGKAEEEERLTGRKETRRSFTEWCAVLTESVIMAVLVIVVIFLTATLVLRSRDASLAPPGKRYYVDSEKYQIHLACVGAVTYNNKTGTRNPTVLLEGGEVPIENSLDDWVWDAYQNGTIDRYCYYDRPGLAWSDNAPSPHSAGMTSEALAEALVAAGEKSPWILVSAGVGGIYSRIFASRHSHQVTGILLIDALHEDLLDRIGGSGRGFRLWAWGVLSPLGYDRLFGAIFQGRTRQDRIYGRSAYQNGKSIKAKLQENLVANSLTHSEVSQARNIQSKNTPLVVVSSGDHIRKDQVWQAKQEDLTTLTDRLISWDVVSDAPHEVWRTLAGRTILEKRLGELVKASKKSKWKILHLVGERGQDTKKYITV